MALKSMSDYQEQPLNLGLKYSLFLIIDSQKLTQEILKNIHDEALKSNTLFSLEKLFKGEKTALVIFAPRELVNKFTNTLDLLELEDYSLKEINNFKAWEIGSKDLSPKLLEKDFFIKLPKLNKEEQLWWQIILKPKIGNFQSIIRVVLITTNKEREQEITEILFDKGKELGITILPQAYSSSELLKFYQQRVLPLDYIKELGEMALLLVTKEQTLALLALKQG